MGACDFDGGFGDDIGADADWGESHDHFGLVDVECVSAPVGYTATRAVTVKTGTGFVACTVEVQRKASTATTWTAISTGTTSGTGVFTASLPVESSGSWNFRLVVVPTDTALSAATASRTIKSITGKASSVSGWSTVVADVTGSTLMNPVTVKTGTGYVARTIQVQRKSRD